MIYSTVKNLLLLSLGICIFACEPVVTNHPIRIDKIDSIVTLPAKELKDSILYLTEIEKKCLASGLVDLSTIDSSILVDLKYSTDDNFLCFDVYGDFHKCYVQADVAEKLKLAQQILQKTYPYYSLVIFDAARPRSVQAKMWDTIAVPKIEKSKYISNPHNGSLHNFGAAVDLSIVDENGIELDMGTPYDYFGELAYPREEERLVKEGKLSHKQLLNRDILRTVMLKSGFMNITTEWWHFNSCFRADAFSKYKIIE